MQNRIEIQIRLSKKYLLVVTFEYKKGIVFTYIDEFENLSKNEKTYFMLKESCTIVSEMLVRAEEIDTR